MGCSRRNFLRSSLVGATALVAGCAGLAGLDRPPRVTLVSLEPVQVTLLEQRYLAVIRIQNPNAVSLPIDGLDYRIALNGAEFADGVGSQRVTVPAYGEKTLEVGVVSTTLRLFEQIKRISGLRGSLRYGISGTLQISGVPAGVDFERDGVIELFPEKAPKGRTA